MKVISLFSGGGLGDYGLELAGMEIVFQCEIDGYCQKILKLRWPHVPKWKDIKTLKTKDLPRCDVIAGGFPCQDISVAGKGEGIKGKRSGLWSEMFRVIRDVRPRYVFVENVTALLGRGLYAVLGDLAACGYGGEWDCIPASAVGADHERDRIWIVAYPSSMGFSKGTAIRKKVSKKDGRTESNIRNHAQEKNMAHPDSRRKSQSKRDKQKKRRRPCYGGEEMADTPGLGMEGNRSPREQKPQIPVEEGIFGCDSPGERANHWSVEPSVGRVAHGVANRVDRLKLLGNGQVVQVVEWIGKRIIDFHNTRFK